jgi:hypothetical protein
MKKATCSRPAVVESRLVEIAEAFLNWSDTITFRRSSSSSRHIPSSLELIESLRTLLGPFLQPEHGSAPLPRLDRDELDSIESAGGYRARLRHIHLYWQFASSIRRAVVSARRLTLLNLDTATLSFDRVLRRDRELAKCVFLIYAAVAMAALKLGSPARLLETVAARLHEIVGLPVPAGSLA